MKHGVEWYSLLVLKVPLNPNRPTDRPTLPPTHRPLTTQILCETAEDAFLSSKQKCIELTVRWLNLFRSPEFFKQHSYLQININFLRGTITKPPGEGLRPSPTVSLTAAWGCVLTKSEWVSEWVGGWVGGWVSEESLTSHQHIIGHFRDESFQSITCTGSNNLTRTTNT